MAAQVGSQAASARGLAARQQDMTGPASPASPATPDPLLALQREFPRYRIWREDISGRVVHVARSLEHGLRPHTVVTGDLDELAAALDPPSMRH